MSSTPVLHPQTESSQRGRPRSNKQNYEAALARRIQTHQARVAIVGQVQTRGAQVSYADPYVPPVALDGSALEAVAATDEVIAAVDSVLILSDHPPFDCRKVVTTAKLVVDTRGATWGIAARRDNLVTW
jgi:UDP-N-acetyl-D-mannosaminuronate dehydrogenase